MKKTKQKENSVLGRTGSEDFQLNKVEVIVLSHVESKISIVHSQQTGTKYRCIYSNLVQ